MYIKSNELHIKPFFFLNFSISNHILNQPTCFKKRALNWYYKQKFQELLLRKRLALSECLNTSYVTFTRELVSYALGIDNNIEWVSVYGWWGCEVSTSTGEDPQNIASTASRINLSSAALPSFLSSVLSRIFLLE